ncbi:MAG: hypothetical protein JWM98_1015 [Thermoleophilia bacterium]|nr:hypothetical protein [Thermoleophilia bacterium]
MREPAGHAIATPARATAAIGGSTTAGAASARRGGGGESSGMFADLPAPVRLQMQLVVCASASPDDALPDVIALLVPGLAAKQAAIVSAISGTDPLREQWERTWHALRH